MSTEKRQKLIGSTQNETGGDDEPPDGQPGGGN